MHRFNVRAVHREAVPGIRIEIIVASIGAREQQLITRAHSVDQIASENHLLGPWHLARLHLAGALLQHDSLMVAVQSVLLVHTPWTLRLALCTRAGLEVFILPHFIWAAWETA